MERNVRQMVNVRDLGVFNRFRPHVCGAHRAAAQPAKHPVQRDASSKFQVLHDACTRELWCNIPL